MTALPTSTMSSPPSSLFCWLAALLAWGFLASTTAQTCPDLAVAVPTLKLRPTVGGWGPHGTQGVRAGGRVNVVATLTNTASTKLAGVNLRVALPDYVVPKHASTWPPLKTKKQPLVQNVRDLYWTDLVLAPGKTRKFRIKAVVPGCQNTSDTAAPLAVEVSAYVVASDGETVTCLTEATPATFRVLPAVKAKVGASSTLCTPVPPPVPIPADAGYIFYASGQRCKDSVLALLQRRELTGMVDEAKDEAGTEAEQHRGLSPSTNPTVGECTYVFVYLCRRGACCFLVFQ